MNTKIKGPEALQLRTATPVPVDWLRLDAQNPRLIALGDGKPSNDRIIEQLHRAEELSELLQSFSANGYMDIEPLIVILSDRKKNLIVLEGNRRLAALMLFRDRDTAKRLKIKVPEVGGAISATFGEVSVYLVPDRSAARAFIGFKHINGAAKWESYAKAKFAADWYRSDDGITLSQISVKIGDSHDTIKRMVAAIYVLEQAVNADLFEIADRYSSRFNFSHLYTALSRKQYMDYLGLDAAWSRYDPAPNPIHEDKLDELKEILIWIFGSRSDEIAPVVQSQNPDIKRLGHVLARSEALHVLRESHDLSAAYRSTEPAGSKFSNAMVRTRESLRDAVNNLRGFDARDHSLLDIAEDINENAETLLVRMRSKIEKIAREATD